jgi:hypothetical protein
VSEALNFGPLPLGDFDWLKLYYFDVEDDVAAWMVRQFNKTLAEKPESARRWLDELPADKSQKRRGLRWYESFTFRDPEGFREVGPAACSPSSYDLFHLYLEESPLAWTPNVTLDPALVGHWTGVRNDDNRPIEVTFRVDAGFEQSGLPLDAFAQQWCVYDGGAELVLRFLERPGKPMTEWTVMPLGSQKAQLVLPGHSFELVHDGKGEPSYVGEWLGGGELRARATGLRLIGRARDGRQWMSTGNVRKLLGGAPGSPSGEALLRPLVARYAACAREAAEAATAKGDAALADALRADVFAAADRVAWAGDRFALAPHASLHDEVMAQVGGWLQAIQRGEFKLGPS